MRIQDLQRAEHVENPEALTRVQTRVSRSAEESSIDEDNHLQGRDETTQTRYDHLMDVMKQADAE